MIRLLLIALLLAPVADAQWSTDPSNNLIVAYGLLPELCSDSAGGAYITYEVSSVYPRHIALRRLNRYGYQPWNTSLAIQGVKPESRFARLASDGRNGVLIAFLDREWNNNPANPWYNDRVRVQRVDSAGNLLWGLGGVRVSLDEHAQHASQYPAIAADGVGGCIVAWADSLGTLRAQRVDISGGRIWGDSGRAITQNLQSTVRIVGTDPDEFVLAYGNLLKRVDLSGNILWGGGAINVGFGTRAICSDNSGGVIIYDGAGISSNILIVAQRVDSSGTFVWPSPYVILDDSAIFNVDGNPLQVDADGNIVFAWTKRVNNLVRAFTQRVRTNGTVVFSGGPLRVSAVDSASNGTWDIVTSELDTKIYINADARGNSSLYAQKMDSSGTRLWSANDNLITSRHLGNVKTTTDGQAGVIVVGFDQSDFSVRAQKCSKHGNLGEILTNIGESLSVGIPTQVILHQNFPNPFNSATTIMIDVPTSTPVNIGVYDLLGQKVQALSESFLARGTYRVVLNARDLASGVYLYRLETTESIQCRKLMILK